jgi:NADPH2:quinone reductase
MKAVWLEEFGGPEVLVAADAPDPVPGPGQALIEVSFANITFVETMFRASGFGPFETELPMIPGNGVGGVVASVGVEVDERLISKRVVASTGGSGGYAERAAVDAGGLVEVPQGLELDSAVALLADGRTAIMLVRKARLREGERVLVEAAAGGVGTLLVQLARAAGARVVAAAGGACKVEVARGIGVEVAVDYREPGWAERVRESVGAGTSSSTGSAATSENPLSGYSTAVAVWSVSGWRAANGQGYPTRPPLGAGWSWSACRG